MALFPLSQLLDTLSDTVSKALRIKGEVSVVGSLAKLSTEPFPPVVEGYTLIEFYPNPDDNKYYRGYLGEWREV